MHFYPIVTFVVLLIAGELQAQTLSIDHLSVAYCGAGDGNGTEIYEREKVSDSAGRKCVMAYAENESHTVISMNGKIIRLKFIRERSTPGNKSKKYPTLGARESVVFRSEDGTVRVALDAKVVSSSCDINTESCCGDSYEGNLVVEHQKARVTVPVNYYRGG